MYFKFFVMDKRKKSVLREKDVSIKKIFGWFI